MNYREEKYYPSKWREDRDKREVYKLLIQLFTAVALMAGGFILIVYLTLN